MTAHKAVVAAVVAAITTFVAALQARTDALALTDWVVIVVSSLAAGLAVYVVPNQAKEGTDDGSYTE